MEPITRTLVHFSHALDSKDAHDFFKRYVRGVERPPYEEALSVVGLQLVRSSVAPVSIRPGGSVHLDIAWTAHVPYPVARTGLIGRFAFIAQWFPKLGVLKNDGWNCHQFHYATEFFSDYGVYDVSLTVPAGWRIAKARVQLDVGHLWNIGEVWLNGKTLGILWTAPFTTDCTAALRDGENQLIVEVTNTWSNRLIGDAKKIGSPITRTNAATPRSTYEPLDSGHLGVL
jgi:hypothetical protein